MEAGIGGQSLYFVGCILFLKIKNKKKALSFYFKLKKQQQKTKNKVSYIKQKQKQKQKQKTKNNKHKLYIIYYLLRMMMIDDHIRTHTIFKNMEHKT